MDVKDWQDRLFEHFGTDDFIGKELTNVIKLEREYGSFVTKTFHGQNVLMDSFFEFFIESFNIAFEKCYRERWPEKRPYYSIYLIYYLTMFRRFRASDNLFRSGYPFDGYTLLRDLKDRTIFLSAIAQGKTSLNKLIGDVNGKLITEENYHEIKMKVKKEEQNLLKEMIREKSGFDENTLNELKIWERLFNEEVHGSRMTFFSELGNWMKTGQISVGPTPIETAYAMYMNRAVEIGWLMARLLPLLQIKPNGFDKGWGMKWKILDDSFRIAIKGFEDLGKKIATAFIIFVEKKFPFSTDNYYVENVD